MFWARRDAERPLSSRLGRARSSRGVNAGGVNAADRLRLRHYHAAGSEYLEEASADSESDPEIAEIRREIEDSSTTLDRLQRIAVDVWFGGESGETRALVSDGEAADRRWRVMRNERVDSLRGSRTDRNASPRENLMALYDPRGSAHRYGVGGGRKGDRRVRWGQDKRCHQTVRCLLRSTAVALPAAVFALLIAASGASADGMAWSSSTFVVAPPVSISCPSTALCVAVNFTGEAVVSTDPIATKPNWSTPVVVASDVVAVACPSPSFCMAVSADGSEAATQDPAAPAPTWSAPARFDRFGDVHGLSCPSTSLCVAVDETGHAMVSTDPTAASPTWRAENVHPGFSLDGVYCLPSVAGRCFAYDDSTLLSNRSAGTGTVWRPLPLEGTDPDVLPAGVSCATPSTCVLVDNAGEATLTSGSPRLQIDGRVPLRGISCSPDHLCVAVDSHGDALTTTAPAPLMDTWSTPVRADPGVSLNAVDCPSRQFCVAVDRLGRAIIGHPAFGSAPAGTGRPRIVGKAKTGAILRSRMRWSGRPVQVRYKWEQCQGSICEEIDGATSSAYKVSASNLCWSLRVLEVAANAQGASTVLTSPRSARITRRGFGCH
jgi:hypothetical protein